MQDLINLIVQTAGVTEDQAKKTVNTMLGYVRNQLPAPIAAQVDTFLAGGGALMLPGLADLMKGFVDVAKDVSGMVGGTTTTDTEPKLSR